MAAEMTQCDSAHQTTNVRQTHSSHVTHDHTHCTGGCWVGCVRPRGWYTWQCCGSKCHMSHSGTTRMMGAHGTSYPVYSQLVHIWPLVISQTLTQVPESFHQQHNLQQVSVAKTMYSASPQLQCMTTDRLSSKYTLTPFHVSVLNVKLIEWNLFKLCWCRGMYPVV